MAFEVGTASHAADLLLKLETFLTTNPTLVAKKQAWKVIKDNMVQPYSTNYNLNNTGSENASQLHRFFIGNGLDGRDEIVVPMKLVVEHQSSIFNLVAYAARRYTPSQGVENQFIDNYNTQPFVISSLWNNPIPYWFFANGRRFVIVAKVGLRYMSMYCGFIMPSGTDIEYSYPLAICGNHDDLRQNYTTSNSAVVGSMVKPTPSRNGYSSCVNVVSPQGDNVRFGASTSTTIYTNSYDKPYTGVIFPHHANIYVGKTLDNQYVLLPIELVQIDNTWQSLGWYDGVYYVSGFENSAENIVTVDNKRYICFPSPLHTDYNHWFAIRME